MRKPSNTSKNAEIKIVGMDSSIRASPPNLLLDGNLLVGAVSDRDHGLHSTTRSDAARNRRRRRLPHTCFCAEPVSPAYGRRPPVSRLSILSSAGMRTQAGEATQPECGRSDVSKPTHF